MPGTVLLVTRKADSAIGVAVKNELARFDLSCVEHDVSTLGSSAADFARTTALRPALRGVVVALDSSNHAKRSQLKDVDELDAQFKELITDELGATFRAVYSAMPSMIASFRATALPSTVVLLGSRTVRASNSPNQIVASVAKRGVQAFAGSLFFERRSDGIRVSVVHPGPISETGGAAVSIADLARSMVYALTVGPTACVESIDLVTVNPLPKPVVEMGNVNSPGCAFVTGASRGIGRAIAVSLAKEGLSLGLVGRDEKALKEAETACLAAGAPKVLGFILDTRDHEALKNALDRTAKELGNNGSGITALVCSAGINRRRPSVTPDGKKFADPKVWAELMDVNTISAMSATAYALPHLVEARSNPRAAGPFAPIVMYVGSRMIRASGAGGQQSYLASKMALAGFKSSVQQELKPLGIRCVGLNVGLVATELGTRAPTGAAAKFTPAPASSQIQPEDVGSCAVFALKQPRHLSCTDIDLCGTAEEYLDAQGKPLKLSGL